VTDGNCGWDRCGRRGLALWVSDRSEGGGSREAMDQELKNIMGVYGAVILCIFILWLIGASQ